MQRLFSKLAVGTCRARFPRTVSSSQRSLKTYTDKWNCLQIKINETDDISELNLPKLIDDAKVECPELKAAWLHADGQAGVIPTGSLKKHHHHESVFENW